MEDLDRALLALEARAVQLTDIQAGGFTGYIARRNPTLLRYAHVPRLASVGDRILAGALKRVMILLPPRYFKSEVFSRLLTSAWLRWWPHTWVGLSSYGAELAWELSEESRGYYVGDGGLLRRETFAKRRWRTQEGGGMFATGVGGALLGRGFHLGVIDDAQDPEQAVSPTYQRRFRAWYPAKWVSRQEPGAAIVVVQQRLGLGDAIDTLLRREVGEECEEAPEGWHVVACEEIRSDDPLGRWGGPRGLPPTCTLEPDPRELGEILSPERFNADQVAAMQRAAGPMVTAAQRQQAPGALTGDFWRAEWFQVYDQLPEDAYDGGSDWDTAMTKDDANAASAWVRSFRGPGKRGRFPIYIHEVGWDWWEFPELVAAIKAVDGPHYVEAKASGKSAVQTLKREGVMAKEVSVSGDKVARSSSAQPIVSQGRVYVRRPVLAKLLEGQRQGLLGITVERLVAGKPDLDLNDAFTQALHRHERPRKLRGAWYPGADADREAREERERQQQEATP